MCVCVSVCVYVSKCVGEFFACIGLEPDFIIVISKASHAIDTRWRFLTALHVNNNNIYITFKPLPNIFLYFSPTEDEDAKFIFILTSIRIHLNEWMKYFHKIIYPAWKLKCRALGRILRRSMVISTVGDDSVLRMKAIMVLTKKWSCQHDRQCKSIWYI